MPSKTSTRHIPSPARAPAATGVIMLPLFITIEPLSSSSPQRMTFSHGFTGRYTAISSFSTSTSSIITTAFAPSGTTPPVGIATQSPLFTQTPGFSPIRTRPVIFITDGTDEPAHATSPEKPHIRPRWSGCTADIFGTENVVGNGISDRVRRFSRRYFQRRRFNIIFYDFFASLVSRTLKNFILRFRRSYVQVPKEYRARVRQATISRRYFP